MPSSRQGERGNWGRVCSPELQPPSAAYFTLLYLTVVSVTEGNRLDFCYWNDKEQDGLAPRFQPSLAHTYLSVAFIKTWELHPLPMHITAGYITAARCPDFSQDKPGKVT